LLSTSSVMHQRSKLTKSWDESPRTCVFIASASAPCSTAASPILALIQKLRNPHLQRQHNLLCNHRDFLFVAILFSPWPPLPLVGIDIDERLLVLLNRCVAILAPFRFALIIHVPSLTFQVPAGHPRLIRKPQHLTTEVEVGASCCRLFYPT
jgi:hypothetical protein